MTIIPHNPLVLETGTVKYETDPYDRLESSSKLTVCVANSPHDFYHMYKNGPQSCMSYGGDGGEGQNKPFSWMMKYTLHPMSSMAYNPHIKGLYVKNSKGKTLFRAMCILKEPVKLGVKPKFANLNVHSYYTDEEDSEGLNDAVVAFLKECGVPFSRNSTVSYIYKTEIPPLNINKDINSAFLVPYFDNHSFGCNLYWNEKKNTFVFESGCGNKQYNYRNLYQIGVSRALYKRTLTAKDMEANKAVI